MLNFVIEYFIDNSLIKDYVQVNNLHELALYIYKIFKFYGVSDLVSIKKFVFEDIYDLEDDNFEL